MASPSGHVSIASMSGQEVAHWTWEEVKERSVGSLKTVLAKKIGINRFRQVWLDGDGDCKLTDEAQPTANMQLVVLQCEECSLSVLEKVFCACNEDRRADLEELLCIPVVPDAMAEEHWENCPGQWLAKRALHVAAGAGSRECTKLLLEADCDVGLKDRNGRTALHHAADVVVVNLLLKMSADLNLQDLQGETPLIRAARCGRPKVVRHLLGLGADRNVRNTCGETALQLARSLIATDTVSKPERPWSRCVQLLEAAQRKRV